MTDVEAWEDVGRVVEEQMQLGHYSIRTLRCYLSWIRRFRDFVEGRPPSEIEDQDARNFLADLCAKRRVSAKTQNQALHALVFLFQRLFGRHIDHLGGVERAPERRRLPQILSREQVRRLLERMTQLPGLMARLCYGCGLRLEECISLRVKDVQLERRQLVVRQGKGDKDRVIPLPRSLVEPLDEQLQLVAKRHQKDLEAGCGHVELPQALALKLPNAARELAWQWMFPGARIILHTDGVARRPHLHPSMLQRALAQAAREIQLGSRVTVHMLRHCYATHLLEDGVNIRRLQELLGHASVQTTMIYLHTRTQPLESAEFSPLDRL